MNRTATPSYPTQTVARPGLRSRLRRSLHLIGAMLKIRLGSRMMYRASFLTAFFVDITVFATQLAVFTTLFLSVDSVNGWSREQMVFFVGTFTIIDGLEMCLFFFGVLSIPDKIRDGKLDLYLAKPANPLLLISFESIDPGAGFIALPGIAMVAWATIRMHVPVTPGRLLGYLFLLALMLVLLYDLLVLLRTVSFWVVQVGALGELENELVNFTFRIPGIVFKGAAKLVFYILLPYSLIATIPTQFFTGLLTGGEWLTTLAVTVVFTVLTQWVWKRGLKRYGSTGS